MISIGRNTGRKIYIDEIETDCVVCSQTGMQNSNTEKVTVHKRMQRDVCTAVWKSKSVACLKFETPKNDFINRYATEVMGREIRGNAILLSSLGLTTADILQVPPVDRSTGASWSAMAKRLPAVVPLDDVALDRLYMEVEDRQEAWREYKCRKNNNKKQLKTAEEVAADDAALRADDEMGQWQVEEEFATQLD